MRRAESALQFISSVDRETWIMCGMALKSEFGDAARDLWMDWSREADSFKESDARAVWRSFKGSGISIASLIHEAKQNGFKDDQGYKPPSLEQIAEMRLRDAARRSSEAIDEKKRQVRAAEKANWILSQCQPECHSYLWSKGLPEHQGLVWRPDEETNLLCIPMWVGGKLSSLQMIDKTGVKKFLRDGITSKAELCFDAHGTDWWVEGWATGWSLKLCLQALKMPYRIHVCFSATNLKKMAHSGFVVADKDSSGTGEEAAKATGLPYWIADEVDTDFNDFWKARGTFKASQALLKWINQTKRKTA